VSDHVSVRIDRIAVQIAAEQRAEQAEEAIRKALALLAARLAQAPLGLGDRAPELALRRLEVGPVDPGWLGSPGAADRLAEDLYRSLLSATGGQDGL
jgi:hypothetical protein